MLEQISKLLETGDSYAVLQLVQSEGSPQEIAKRYHQLMLDAYWKAKNLPVVVTLARCGIHYGLTKSAESPDAREKIELASVAKGMAYDLASFVWPGWDEKGISPTPCDVAIGLDAAKLNLRLAKELNKPADRVQDAHWLLGAHLLSANDPAGALTEFEQTSPQTRPLHRGYVLLMHILLGQEGAQQEFDELLAKMRSQTDDKDAKFNEGQLVTAYRMFVKPQ